MEFLLDYANNIYMYGNELFKKFCKERNIKKSTVEGYNVVLNHYADFHGENINVDVIKNGPHIQIHKDIKNNIHKQIDIKNNIENDNKKDIHKQIDIKNNIKDDIKKDKKDDILIDNEDDNKMIIECNIEDKATAVGSLEAPTAISTFDENVYEEIIREYQNSYHRRAFWKALADAGKVYFDEAQLLLKTNSFGLWTKTKEIRESIKGEKGWE